MVRLNLESDKGEKDDIDTKFESNSTLICQSRIPVKLLYKSKKNVY